MYGHLLDGLICCSFFFLDDKCSSDEVVLICSDFLISIYCFIFYGIMKENFFYFKMMNVMVN